MYGTGDEDHNVMYYLTVYNEPIHQPAEPENVDVDGIVNGIYLLKPAETEGPRAQLLASGVGVPWALEAQQILADEWGVSADVWSVTSWTNLRRDAMAAEQDAFLDPESGARTPYITQALAGATGPVVATSDYASQLPDSVRQYVPNDWASLGADGFGFADTRAGARRFFTIDAHSMVVRTLEMLAKRGEIDWSAPAEALTRYKLTDPAAGTSGNAGGDA